MYIDPSDDQLSALLPQQEAPAAPAPAPEQPPVAPEPTATPPGAEAAGQQPSGPDDDSDLDALLPMMGQGGGRAQPLDIPPPPLKQKPSEGPAVAGLVADLLLNKGRGMPQMIAQFGSPQDTDYDNWKRQLEWQKARYANVGRPVDPFTQMMRLEELKARRGALHNQAANVSARNRDAATRAATQKRELDVNDPRTAAVRNLMYEKYGYAPGSLDQMDYKALSQMLPTVRKDIETAAGAPLEQQAVRHAGREAAARREPIPEATKRATAVGGAHATATKNAARADEAAALTPPAPEKKGKSAQELRDEGWH